MKKLFISQPMRGRSDEEILKEREEIIQYVKNKYPYDEIEVIDSFFQEAPVDVRPMWYLGKSIELLSTADIACFAKGYMDARGCRIEHTCAHEYGIETVIEWE